MPLPKTMKHIPAATPAIAPPSAAAIAPSRTQPVSARPRAPARARSITLTAAAAMISTLSGTHVNHGPSPTTANTTTANDREMPVLMPTDSDAGFTASKHDAARFDTLGS